MWTRLFSTSIDDTVIGGDVCWSWASAAAVDPKARQTPAATPSTLAQGRERIGSTPVLAPKRAMCREADRQTHRRRITALKIFCRLQLAPSRLHGVCQTRQIDARRHSMI